MHYFEIKIKCQSTKNNRFELIKKIVEFISNEPELNNNLIEVSAGAVFNSPPKSPAILNIS